MLSLSFTNLLVCVKAKEGRDERARSLWLKCAVKTPEVVEVKATTQALKGESGTKAGMREQVDE